MGIKFLDVSEQPPIQLRHAYFPTTSEKEENKNRTIVMVPGWLDRIEKRTDLIEEFRKYSNVIFCEPRGFGESSAPHKHNIYTVKHLTDDLSKMIEQYHLKDKEFYMWGSCLGSAMAFIYCIDKKGPLPRAIIASGPVSKFKTPWWFNLVKGLPFFIIKIIEKIAIAGLKLYLRFKRPEETQNVDYAIKRFDESDLYVQIRILLEFIHKYDIRGQEEKLKDIPIKVFSAKADWFTEPEQSEIFARLNLLSELTILMGDHRIVRDRYQQVAQETKNFLIKIETSTKKPLLPTQK